MDLDKELVETEARHLKSTAMAEGMISSFDNTSIRVLYGPGRKPKEICVDLSECKVCPTLGFVGEVARIGGMGIPISIHCPDDGVEE